MNVAFSTSIEIASDFFSHCLELFFSSEKLIEADIKVSVEAIYYFWLLGSNFAPVALIQMTSWLCSTLNVRFPIFD